MKFEQDYMMRVIKTAVETLARLLFQKTDAEFELNDETEYTAALNLYVRLLELADSGDVNGAENLLYAGLDTENQDFLEIGISFYHHINGYDDEFLTAHDYEREEIRDGIRQLLEEYRMGNMADLLEI